MIFIHVQIIGGDGVRVCKKDFEPNIYPTAVFFAFESDIVNYFIVFNFVFAVPCLFLN